MIGSPNNPDRLEVRNIHGLGSLGARGRRVFVCLARKSGLDSIGMRYNLEQSAL